jgi:hypothetical protein
MGTVGDDYAELLIDNMLGSSHVAGVPNTVYLALYNDLAGDDGLGGEVSGLGYVRQAIPNTDAYFPLADSEGLKILDQDIIFPQATAYWGVIVSWALHDAIGGTGVIFWGRLGSTSPQSVPNGATAIIRAGTIFIKVGRSD